MIPALDLAGFISRTLIPAADVQLVESVEPGWILGQSELVQSHAYARLRKRYGTKGNNGVAGIPFGGAPAQPTATGTDPPEVTLSGVPTPGCLRLLLAIVLGGAVTAATFQWSTDRGQTWTIGATLAGTGPTIGCAGASVLDEPSDLVAQITAGGSTPAALFQWSSDGGVTWNIGAQMQGAGSNPPPVLLSGASTLALPSKLQVQIEAPGSLGVATYQWSQDGGVTWTTGVQTSAQITPLGVTGLSVQFMPGAYSVGNDYQGQGIATAAAVALPGTGLALSFGAGTYVALAEYSGQGIATSSAGVALTGTGVTAAFVAGEYTDDNVYSAATPVPEQILGWMTAILSPSVMTKRGVNPQDPLMVQIVANAERAEKELLEAANSETGLIDLPTNDSSDSAVSTGEPLGHADASPYAWQDRQAAEGRRQDYGHGGGNVGSGIWGR